MSDGFMTMTNKSIIAGQDVRVYASQGFTAVQMIVQVQGEPGVRVIPLDQPCPFTCTALFLVVAMEGAQRAQLFEVNPPEHGVTVNEFTYSVPASRGA